MSHPPRIPVWLRADQPVVYFLTLCEEHRRPAWDNQSFFGAFNAAIERLRSGQLWFIRSAIVMPDHLHLRALPIRSRDDRVGNLTGALKRWTKEAYQAHDREWDSQPGGFDRLLRKDESAENKWEYMRDNPVRAGLVRRWQDWPWKIGIRDL